MSWNVRPSISSREYPRISQNFWFMRSQRPSGATWAMPTAACSNVTRKRASLSRTSISAFLRARALAKTWAISRNPITVVSDQSLLSRMTAKPSRPRTGPSPTDNGTRTVDWVR